MVASLENGESQISATGPSGCPLEGPAGLNRTSGMTRGTVRAPVTPYTEYRAQGNASTTKISYNRSITTGEYSSRGSAFDISATCGSFARSVPADSSGIIGSPRRKNPQTRPRATTRPQPRPSWAAQSVTACPVSRPAAGRFAVASPCSMVVADRAGETCCQTWPKSALA